MSRYQTARLILVLFAVMSFLTAAAELAGTRSIYFLLLNVLVAFTVASVDHAAYRIRRLEDSGRR